MARANFINGTRLKYTVMKSSCPPQVLPHSPQMQSCSTNSPELSHHHRWCTPGSKCWITIMQNEWMLWKLLSNAFHMHTHPTLGILWGGEARAKAQMLGQHILMAACSVSSPQAISCSNSKFTQPCLQETAAVSTRFYAGGSMGGAQNFSLWLQFSFTSTRTSSEMLFSEFQINSNINLHLETIIYSFPLIFPYISTFTENFPNSERVSFCKWLIQSENYHSHVQCVKMHFICFFLCSL